VVRSFLAVAWLGWLAGCVVPYALPPLKAELGGSTVRGDRPTFHVGGGAHLASGVLDKDQKFDLGVGGFGDWNGDGLATTAGYVDAAAFVERSEKTRTSIGARGEVRWTATGAGVGRGFGGMLRVEHEMFAVTHSGYSGTDRCSAIGGAAHGTGGVGMFAEAGRVTMPGVDRGAWTATAGVTLRIPSTIGILVGIPGC